ncbi:L-selectin-like [Stigmatopora argus]
MTWSEARKWCQMHYTDMVVIQNQDENAALVSFLPNKSHSPYYWLGITKEREDEDWIWIGNNSTWVGEESWAENEPNNKQSWPVCVELYVNDRAERGKWNDEKCRHAKFAVCYQAQCNATICGRGRCQETVNNVTCLCEEGFEGEAFQAVSVPPPPECPPLSTPNGYFHCAEGNHTLNSSCQFICHAGFLRIGSAEVTCGVTANWGGPRPACASYKFLLIVVGCAVLTFFCSCCMCVHWTKSRKRKNAGQLRSVLIIDQNVVYAFYRV